ncbi:hypothetical protein ACET3X_009567 [Alternaria dauci]|uniref:Uncharacterized protein n=1 Tax=Alternaria dauci TaxID=48095 RepID=A0ABR3U5W6_9PLEO
MQYRFVSIIAAGVLVGMTSAAPVPSAETQTLGNDPANTIGLGKPSTVITWGKRGDTPTNPDDVQLGRPTTEIIWSKDKKRGVSFGTPEDIFTLGKPNTVVTWEKRDEPDTIENGVPTTVVTWGKEKRDEVEQPDTIELGKPTTEITWGKRDVTTAADPADTIELGKPSTVITWGKEKRNDPPVLSQPDSETTWTDKQPDLPV